MGESAAKAALDRLPVQLAQERRATPIKVNSVGPNRFQRSVRPLRRRPARSARGEACHWEKINY
jgi:NAD(P)-dependent dehydrogenase (short-subunit alcohol dehydrogenase family)